jgi:hypothetical protein
VETVSNKHDSIKFINFFARIYICVLDFLLGFIAEHGYTLGVSRLVSRLTLPLQQRVTYQLAVLTYKICSLSTPQYLSIHLNSHLCERTLRSSSAPLLTVLRIKTEFARRSFHYATPHTWNSLPVTVQICSSLPSFKTALKAFLFNQAFN